MSIFSRYTGGYDFQRPDLEGYDWPELRDVVARIERLGGELTEATRTARELADSRREAERKDTAAFAEAIQAGRKDPGEVHTTKLEAQIRRAERRRDALRVALQDLGPEVLSVIEEGRADWLPEVREGLSEATERLEEARRAMQRAEVEQARHRELIAWLEDPEGYKPGKASKVRGVTQAPKARPPAFSVMGGRPSSAGASPPAKSDENTHALRITRGGAA